MVSQTVLQDTYSFDDGTGVYTEKTDNNLGTLLDELYSALNM